VPSIGNVPGYGYYYLVQITRYVFPVSMMGVTLFAIALRRKMEKREFQSPVGKNLILLLVFTGFTVVSVACFMPLLFFRYVTPLIPVCCIIMALGVESWMRWRALAGIAVILVISLAIAFQIMGETHNLPPRLTCWLSEDAKRIVIRNEGNEPAVRIHITLVPLGLEVIKKKLMLPPGT
jgi:uncharacterized membrane protein